MAIKKKVAYQKAALKRTRAAALKANVAKKVTLTKPLRGSSDRQRKTD